MRQITSDRNTIQWERERERERGTHTYALRLRLWVPGAPAKPAAQKARQSKPNLSAAKAGCVWVTANTLRPIKVEKGQTGKKYIYAGEALSVWLRLCVCVAVEADTWGKILKIHEHAQDIGMGMGREIEGSCSTDAQTGSLLELQVAYLPYDKCSLECHDCQRGTAQHTQHQPHAPPVHIVIILIIISYKRQGQKVTLTALSSLINLNASLCVPVSVCVSSLELEPFVNIITE